MQADEIAQRLSAVRGRIDAAAQRSGRDPARVRLIAVSKTVSAAAVVAACRAGHAEFGENRVQEGVAKAAEVALAGYTPVWHMIGTLQSNKVSAAVHTFAMIHSVDSLRIAEILSRKAPRGGVPIDVLAEVNVADEQSKQGFAPEEIPAVVRALRSLPGLTVKGLMTVAPQVDDAEEVRPIFGRLQFLAESLGLPELSMGMSGDYEVAIEEGATIVRVGTAIFGRRR